MDQTCDLSNQISLEEVVEAYYTCRKNKRNTGSPVKVCGLGIDLH